MVGQFGWGAELAGNQCRTDVESMRNWREFGCFEAITMTDYPLAFAS